MQICLHQALENEGEWSLELGLFIFKLQCLSLTFFRMDTDVIKLIESKHEVTLLGSNLNEFCVKFYGPRGEWQDDIHWIQSTLVTFRYTVRDRHLESSCSPARTLSFQVTVDWLHEQNLPSKHWWSIWNSLFRRHQSGLDSPLWLVEYLWVVSATTAYIPKSNWPS